MLDLILITLSSFLSGFRGQAALQAENIALRHQVTVLQRTHTKRPVGGEFLNCPKLRGFRSLISQADCGMISRIFRTGGRQIFYPRNLIPLHGPS